MGLFFCQRDFFSKGIGFQFFEGMCFFLFLFDVLFLLLQNKGTFFPECFFLQKVVFFEFSIDFLFNFFSMFFFHFFHFFNGSFQGFFFFSNDLRTKSSKAFFFQIFFWKKRNFFLQSFCKRKKLYLQQKTVVVFFQKCFFFLQFFFSFLSQKSRFFLICFFSLVFLSTKTFSLKKKIFLQRVVSLKMGGFLSIEPF